MTADRAPGAWTPEQWARVSRALDEAFDLSPEAVPAFLDRVCAGDAALRGHLERLMAADREAGDFLTGTGAEWGARLSLEAGAEPPSGPLPGELRPGDVLGSFRIVREIGRGGMGAVYLAERADGAFDQQVAIKVLQTGAAGREFLARFVQERRILARLQHPHIARLLDGGVTRGGLPYFAMEYVDGIPLTRYCREHAVNRAGALVLFIQVCEAVAYAHRNLVVHRDLKPGNILVSRTGEVKLLDFGIAKALEDELDSGESTQIRALTPHYAAPEQIRGEAPTTATDVYALGVVLFELLTGERLYGETTRTPGGVTRAVLHDPPRAPSRAAPDRSIPRDLDHIVLQALRKHPDERYPSADLLLEDLRLFRSGRPVQASPPTLGYLAGKFVRRNRLLVTAAALAVASLVAGLVGTAWQARVADRERDRARLEARKATRIKDFALGLFQYSDPYQSYGPDITARQMLEKGVDWSNLELSGDPETRIEILNIIGNIYRNLTDFDTAESLLTRAVDLARTTYGPEHELVATSLGSLGSDYLEAGDYERALAYEDSALAMRLRLFGDRHPSISESLNELAVTHTRLGRYEIADSLYRRMIAIDQANHEEETEVAIGLNNRGILLGDMGRDEEAVEVLQRALEIRERVLGHDNVTTAVTMGALANVFNHLGRFDRAESLYAGELSIRQRLLPPDHMDVALSLENLAGVVSSRGDYPRARVLFDRAVAIRERHQPPEHQDMARLYNNLGVLNYRMGDFAGAAARFRQALVGLRANLGENHPGTLSCRNNLGVALRSLGRYAEAEPILRETLQARRAALGEDHPHVGQSLYHLGLLCRFTGRDGEAENDLRRALAIDRAAGYPTRVIETLVAMGDVLRDRGALQESLALLAEAKAACDTVYAQPEAQTAEVDLGLGRTLFALDRGSDAEAALRQALEVRHRLFPPDHPLVAQAETALGCCLAASRPAEARALLAHGVLELTTAPPGADPLLAQGRAALDRLSPH